MSNMQESETSLPEPFDPATQEGTNLLPTGTYPAQITDASVSQPQNGDGWGVGLTWQITEGKYEGRYVWQHITLTHSSTIATAIGRRQFKDLCVATGIDETVTDVSVFKFIPCRIRVGIEEDKKGVYEDKNKVSRIKPLETSQKQPKQGAKLAQPTATSAAATVATQQTTTPSSDNSANSGNGSVPPWRAAKPSPSEELDDKVAY